MAVNLMADISRHQGIVDLLVDAAGDAGMVEVPDYWWPEGFSDDPATCQCREHRNLT